MRPQFPWRAARATAAVGALLLASTGSGRVASASAPLNRTAARHRQRRARSAPARLQALLLRPNVLLGGDIAYVGLIRPAGAPHRVALEALEGRRWVAVARARSDQRGVFVTRFWPGRLGRVVLRLRASAVAPTRITLSARIATVYHEVIASWYGPGGVTACGETLEATTLGVANKTLPCGTLVTLRYRGRVVRVPVIDRGPFVAGRDYDLTYATKLALGAGDVSEIWASA